MLAEGKDLSPEDAEEAALAIMEGKASEGEMAAFLTAMRMKGETAEEIASIAKVMRGKCLPVSSPPGAMDLCGTGGAKIKTYNISTISSLAVAAAGVPVAKHGNRSFTSRSGSADVLESLGVDILAGPEAASGLLRDAGIAFLFAPVYHPAMKNVIPVRRALAFRTVFNLLGPLTNPAMVRRQLIGVFSEDYMERMASALAILGSERAMVVHGMAGLDEISPSGETKVAEVRNGVLERYSIDASDFSEFGTGEWSPPGPAGPGESAEFAMRVLGGHASAGESSIVLLNAGAALYVSGKASSIEKGMTLASEMIERGKARERLELLVRRSRQPGGSGNG